MDAKQQHHRVYPRLGGLGSMIGLLLCVATVTAGDGHDHHRHNRNSHHSFNHHNSGRHSRSHHDQHGHHFIIHVPRYYLLFDYGFPAYYGRNDFFQYPYYRRPYYYGYGYSSGPAYIFSGYGGTKGPTNTGPVSGNSVSIQEHNGWELLADGRASLALDAFAQQTQRNPKFGGPIIGYALSVATAGDLYFGVWEMRRALRTNPSSLQAFELPQKLRPTLETLIEKFKAEHLNKNRKADVSFMLAALHYLIQNTDAAKAAIDLAIQERDLSQSALNLKRIIDR
jgi:hypothetical protein